MKRLMYSGLQRRSSAASFRVRSNGSSVTISSGGLRGTLRILHYRKTHSRCLAASYNADPSQPAPASLPVRYRDVCLGKRMREQLFAYVRASAGLRRSLILALHLILREIIVPNGNSGLFETFLQLRYVAACR